VKFQSRLGKLFLLMMCAGVAGVTAQDGKDNGPTVDWRAGPVLAKIGGEAQINVPEGYLFADSAGAQTFLELTENIPHGNELGILTKEDADWFVIFTFDDVGYIKDDEKDSLDADAMLDSIKEATVEANEERRDRGWSTMSVVGWVVKPHYEESTHNIEWSLRGRDDGDGVESVNHHTRYLGRKGVMNAELVADTKDFEATLASFRQVMGGFAYVQGKDYLSFVPGDKVAEYGLTALVVGGAAAAAAKTGLLKGLWKLILASWKLIAVGVAGLGAALKRFFSPKKQPDTAPDIQA
jgi:uncharacterized membrane-anchored protein